MADRYSLSSFPSRDAWGTVPHYRVSPDGLHFLLASAGEDLIFQPQRERVSTSDWQTSAEFDEPGGDIVCGDSGLFLESPRGLAGALDQITWLDRIEEPLRVEPAGPLTLARAQPASFEVIVTAQTT